VLAEGRGTEVMHGLEEKQLIMNKSNSTSASSITSANANAGASASASTNTVTSTSTRRLHRSHRSLPITTKGGSTSGSPLELEGINEPASMFASSAANPRAGNSVHVINPSTSACK
jgi:hypothetical protein